MPNDNEGNSGRFDRRSFLKTVGVSSVASSGLFASGSVARGKEAVPLSPEDHTVPNPDIDYHRPHQSLLETTSQWKLLAFSEDSLLGYIDDSDVSAKEKREARQTLLDLRSRFPVVEERDTEDENRIWWTLAEGADSRTKRDTDKFQQVARVHADGMSSNDFSTQWWWNSHRKMTREGAKDMGLSDTKADNIAQYADDPDKVDHVSVELPDSWMHDEDLEDAFEAGLNKVHRHYSHYLNTLGSRTFSCYHNSHSRDYDIGTADVAGNWHMDQAYDAYYTSTQDEYLGKATHYPQDTANPLHSGMGWDQLTVDLHYDSDEDDDVGWSISTHKWLHDEYEEFISDCWTDRWYFRDDFKCLDCDECYHYYPIDDPAQAIWDMADYSGQYSAEVYNKIHDEGNVDWTDWSYSMESDIEDITENCLVKAGHYTRGFLHEFY